MIQEEKSLLIKDLCARLQYEVKCYPVITNGEPNTIGGYCEVLNDFYIREVGGWFPISMIKPYLRQMSSMTEEEKRELGNISCEGNIEHKYGIFYRSQDYLNSIHVDYRGLIEKGLALKAPEDMYKIKL